MHKYYPTFHPLWGLHHLLLKGFRISMLVFSLAIKSQDCGCLVPTFFCGILGPSASTSVRQLWTLRLEMAAGGGSLAHWLTGFRLPVSYSQDQKDICIYTSLRTFNPSDKGF